jgi:2-amino-4-hydroxy-6-hydroxymethyldihydropteridine diphosphokinase
MMRGFLSLGSNLGDREAYLKDALRHLATRGAQIIKASRIYETVPVEVTSEQGNYLNMVVEVAFEGEPLELLDLCQRVEGALGRVRPYTHAPRTIDIDILLIHDILLDQERLILPHPRIEKRTFVIYPLAEIAPDLILPSGRTVTQVKINSKNDEIIKIRDL